MSAIRVLIGDMPAILQSTVAEMLEDEDGIVVIDSETRSGRDHHDVDVMLVAADRIVSGLGRFGSGSTAWPVGIVAIADDIQTATIIQVSQSHWPLADQHNDSIGTAIRLAARSGTVN